MTTIRMAATTHKRLKALKLKFSAIYGDYLSLGDVVNLLINRYESTTPSPEYVQGKDFEEKK